MRRTIIPLGAAGAICLHLALIGQSARAAPPVPEPAKPRSVGWRLGNTRVVSPGKTMPTREGTLTTGYLVEGQATPMGEGVVAGRFQASLTFFTPSRDLPGQKAGRCYLGGSWTITSPSAARKEQQLRENPLMARGRLMADLASDPRAKPSQLDALVTLPRLSSAGWPAPLRGVFSGNEKFEGTISIVLRHPEVRGRYRR